MSREPLKICLASSEFTPLAKTGGLADVASALSIYLEQDGHDIRVLLPFYSSIDTSGMNITPVKFQQDLTMQLGPHRIGYSIDTVQLPGSMLKISPGAD